MSYVEGPGFLSVKPLEAQGDGWAYKIGPEWVCLECGAAVVHKDVHEAWHLTANDTSTKERAEDA